MVDVVVQNTEVTVPRQGTDERRCSEAAVAFVNRIRGLETGRLAALRRNAGNTLAEAVKIGRFCWFYGILDQHRVSAWNEEAYFLTATLLAWDKATIRDGVRNVGDFGRSMKNLAISSPSQDSVGRRFGILLDAEFDSGGGGELAFRLRQTVKLLLSKRIPIDWPVLLDDLCRWSVPGKPVQKKWARSYYSAPEQLSCVNTTTEITEQGDDNNAS